MQNPTAKQQQLLADLSPPATAAALLATSQALEGSIRAQLQDPAGATFLPSFTHALPSGREAGTVVAVDLGGSTLRVAVVQLPARAVLAGRRRNWPVSDAVRRLPGPLFFDWVAARIAEVIVGAAEGGDGGGAEDGAMSVGLTWSFPIAQTSEGSGEIQQMGKGFRLFEGLVGADLRTHFEAALLRRGLPGLRLRALQNDTAATLLAHAYDHPRTRLSLICGTGVNAALWLPVVALHPAKFARRPEGWAADAARHRRRVLVNSECSMLGGGHPGVFALTDADRLLDAAAEAPGFQPFEQLTGGRYLGEVARLTLVQAGLACPGRWSLSSAVLALFELDATRDEAASAFEEAYGLQLAPTESDLVAAVCRAVARRAAAYLAAMLHALYCVLDAEDEDEDEGDGSIGPGADANANANTGAIEVACCGAVLEKHPTVRAQCQGFLDALAGPGRIVLAIAEDSGLMGAAVGAVIAEDDDDARARL